MPASQQDAASGPRPTRPADDGTAVDRPGADGLVADELDPDATDPTIGATATAADPTIGATATAAAREASSFGFTGIVRTGMAVVGPDRSMLALLCAVAVVVSLLEVGVLFLVARLALSLTSAEEGIRVGALGVAELDMSPGGAIALAGGLLVALVLLSIPLASLSGRISQRALRRNRRRVLDGYLHASWAVRSNDPEGHLQELVGVYAQYAERLVMQLNTILVALCGTAALAAGAVVVSPVVAILAGIGLVGLAGALLPLSRTSQRSALEYQSRNKHLSSDMAQTSRLSAEIVVFDVPDTVADEMQPAIDGTAEAVRRTRFVQRIMPLLYVDGALAMILVLLTVLNASDADRIAAVGPVVLLLVRGLGYLKQLQTAIQSGREFAPYGDYLVHEVARLESIPQASGSTELATLAQVRFEDVAFAYGGGPPVFSGVDLTIDRGEAVGVVGPSGGGKTTFSQLLLRLREPTGGRVAINGTDLRDVQAEAWSRLVAFVPQDNDLVRATVADNIRFYRDGIDDDQVEAAARAAHLHEEILALPHGYRTRIGPGERDLSGGQRQRLGLARALVCEPQLLVLDEPTSALDHRSEQAIRRTLHELRGTTTIVIIAHRPATLEVCDRLLRVGGGRIVEAGPAEVPPSELAVPAEPVWTTSADR